ncbi:MAG: right-handed parallel beta-helix repeat-containing protein [Thermoplasmata archaeon]|nr:MAG: right-handed parallel beta-helix repeat-containing protein [Thermoplasmata archaeon]
MNRKAVAIWLTLLIVLSFIIIIVDIAPVIRAQTTLYVDDVPGSGGPGDPPEDFIFIQDAINASSDGDTIYVYNGTYYENVIVNKTINLTGEDKNTTIINGDWGNKDVVDISADWVNITGFNITEGEGGFYKGVKLESVHNCRIYNNIIINNDYGIYLSSSNNNTLTNNTASSNNFHGIYLYSSSNCTIAHNNASFNNIMGIYLSYSSNNTIANNNASSNDEHGIFCSCSSDNTVINNTVAYNKYEGIYLSDSSSNTFIDNTVTNNIVGISLSYCTNNNITNNTVSTNTYEGIRLYSSDNNTIANNIVSWHNYSGIALSSSDGNTVANNTISNSSYGIYLSHTRSNTISNNTMVGNSIYITGSAVGQWTSHIIDTNNTVNGKPVYYLKNQNGGRIPSNAGQIILANCRNIIAENQIMINGTMSIVLGFSDNNIIANNTASLNTLFGIYLYYSDNNIITNNTASSNTLFGIYLYNSDSSTITNNNASSNNINGIYLSGADCNTIVNNTLSNNERGIYFAYSGDNIIKNNRISNNLFGINLSSGSTYNIFHHNYIINNLNQIFLDTFNCGGNTWDDGMGEGNYWSDYMGVDDGSNGRTAGDEVGDTLIPHPVTDQGFGYYQLDNYPLMHTKPPRIQLISPGNNSIIPNTTVLDFSIIDVTLIEANYSVNGGANTSFTDPFDIDTGGWADRDYHIQVNAVDFFGYANSSWYFFIIDSIPPFFDSATEDFITYTGDNFTIYANLTDSTDVTSVTIHYRNDTGSWTSMFMDKVIEGGPGSLDHFNITSSDLGIFTLNDMSEWYFYYEATDSLHNSTHGNLISYFTITIIDNIPPIPEAGFDQIVDEDTLISVDASDSTDNLEYLGMYYTWDWDASDGIQVETTTISATHIYPDPGIYIVTLNVTDASGNWDTDTLTVIVLDVTSPDAVIGPDQIVDEDTLVTVDADASFDNNGTSNLSYAWDWNASDGIQVDNNTISATHVYHDPGIYIVTLNVTDASGNWDIDTLTVIVKDVTSPDAVIGLNPMVDEDKLVTADAGASTDNSGTSGLSYAWDWDASNGIQVENNTISATHVYLDPGIYTVTMNVTDASGNWDIDTLTVIVIDVTSPIADAGSNQIVDEDTLVTVNAEASTDNNGTSGLTYIWDWDASDGIFEDNNTITASHIYSEPGVYTVALNVTDSSGNWDVATIIIIVVDITSPIADAGSNTTAVERQEFVFNGTGSHDNSGKDGLFYNWAFVSDDELVTLIGISPSYTFELPGTYIVTLYVFDDAGNWNVDTVTIIVLPDFDEDGVPDIEDDDDDNDGYLDEEDAFPLDPNKWKEDEEPSFMIWIIILVLVVIIICIVVLLFVKKKRGQKPKEEVDEAQTPSPPSPQPTQQPVQPPEAPQSFPPPPVPPVPPPPVPPVPPSPVQEPPPPPPEITTYNCPHCENPFSVPAPVQAHAVICPSCGGQVTIGPVS